MKFTATVFAAIALLGLFSPAIASRRGYAKANKLNNKPNNKPKNKINNKPNNKPNNQTKPQKKVNDDNQETLKAVKKWDDDNKEETLKAVQKWDDDNKEETLKAVQKWDDDNKEETLKAVQKWDDDNWIDIAHNIHVGLKIKEAELLGLIKRKSSSYTTDGRDGYRKGPKSFKDKKSNRVFGYMTEGLKKTGVTSVKTHQNAPVFEEAYNEMEERYMEYVDLMRFKVLFPKEIKKKLDEHVIGQESIKKTVANAVYCHYKRLEHNLQELKNKRDGHVDIDKSNVLLLGPTGCGKTLIAKTTAQLLDVPFSMNDATPFTQAGYVGEDVESCIGRLLQNADYDVQRAERGIVFIDEIDKIAKKSDMMNPNQKDVSGEGVQQGLLRILEGTKVTVNVKPGATSKRYGAGSYEIDTTNILFICSGAFVGLDKVVQDRVGKKGSIGFDKFVKAANEDDLKEPLQSVESDDLIKFGLIPEFIGRLPVIASASLLTVDDLVAILKEPKHALLKQYKEIFRRSDMELFFHPCSIRKIAEVAVEKKTGARGLKRIIENVLNEALFENAGTSVRFVVVDPNLKIYTFDQNGGHEALTLAEQQ